MGSAIEFILQSILSLLILVIIINAVISWLVAFDVINLRHPTVRQIARFFDAVSTPILAPFRRIVPSFGGVDVSPILAWIVLEAISRFLIPWAFIPIKALIG